jgi:four helix bundle protein
MQSFRDFKVWQKAHELTLAVYKMTETWPSEEKYGLTSQIRRAAASVPTNIAEGSKRRSPQDFARFSNIAEGSTSETSYLLILSKDLGYVTSESVEPLMKLTEEIGAMLHVFRSKVEQQKPLDQPAPKAL